MTGRRGDKARLGQRTSFSRRISGPAVEEGTDTASEPSEGSYERQLKRAKNSAYRFLTIRPRSRTEVELKLADRGFPPEIISSVIEHLFALGYLNDGQFARQWAACRVRSRGFGRRRVEQELRAKGITPDIVRDSLREVFADEPEADIARREADKKLRTLARFEPEVRRRRLAGFLERKGFSSETVRMILRKVR